MATAIVGANWGDEGKGKVTDVLAATSDIVVRFQGGNNAGHTIINEHGRFALHLLPSGSCYPHVVNVIGPGVALNIKALKKELDGIAEQGIKPQLKVSDRAQVLLDVHRLFDAWEEERLGDKGFGSTKSGIAPFYADKYSKIGIQVCELFDEPSLMERLTLFCERKNPILEHIFKRPPLTPEALLPELRECAEIIRPYVCDTTEFLHEARMAGKKILLEGQLGSLKDTDHGIYPFVTSSSPLAGFASVGAGIPPYAIETIITVVKAYSSAVGAGPFVSEIFGDEAQELRVRGGDKGEFGATTGRPRRMGWFDVPATRYGCRIQGATDVVLALIDVLSYLKEIPVCVAYELDGKRIDRFPATPELNRCKPVLEKLQGWNVDIRGVRTFEELPEAARDYVLFVEKAIGVPVTYVSNGPRREDMIYRGKVS